MDVMWALVEGPWQYLVFCVLKKGKGGRPEGARKSQLLGRLRKELKFGTCLCYRPSSEPA